MPDDENQSADTPKRPRTSRSPRRVGRKQTAQTISSPEPKQEAAASLAEPNAAVGTTPQSLPAPEVSARPALDEPPTGERWGEFPPIERQAELKRMLEAWEQEQDHGNRPSAFADVALTGADVYWLAALAAGAGDVAVGKRLFNEQPKYHFVGIVLSSLHLAGANLLEAHLEGANLLEAHLEGVSLGGAHLEGAELYLAHLEEAHLSFTHLEGADLGLAHLEGALQLHFLGDS